MEKTMKHMNTLTAMTLAALLAILPGCSDSAPPPELTVVRSTQSEPAKEAPMEEAPSEEVASEEAPAGEASAETPAPAASGTATYIIEPNDVNNLGFTGYKPTGNQQGSWGEYEGTVVVTDGNIESSQIAITFDMPSLITTAPMLTDTLKTESWFNVASFPLATFTSTGVKKTDAGYDVSGKLELRGSSTDITFPATIEIDGDTLKTQADFALLRSDWGMTDTGWGDDLVRDEVRITFEIEAEKQ